MDNNIDDTLIKLISLMPSIGKCETVYESELIESIINSSYQESVEGERMQFELKFQDFVVDVRIYEKKYYCYINISSHGIKESTYTALDNYCKKYNYGGDNHIILAKRIGAYTREKKLERILNRDQ